MYIIQSLNLTNTLVIDILFPFSLCVCSLPFFFSLNFSHLSSFSFLYNVTLVFTLMMGVEEVARRAHLIAKYKEVQNVGSRPNIFAWGSGFLPRLSFVA